MMKRYWLGLSISFILVGASLFSGVVLAIQPITPSSVQLSGHAPVDLKKVASDKTKKVEKPQQPEYKVPEVDIKNYHQELERYQQLQRSNENLKLEIQNRELKKTLESFDEDKIRQQQEQLKQEQLKQEQLKQEQLKQEQLKTHKVIQVIKPTSVMIAIVSSGNNLYRAKVFDKTYGLRMVTIGSPLEGGFVVAHIREDGVIARKGNREIRLKNI